MTSMLSASRLPEALEEFAVEKRGPAWGEWLIAGFNIALTVEKLGEISATSQGLRCKRMWVPDSNLTRRDSTAYALSEAETRRLSVIPEEVLPYCGFMDEEGTPLELASGEVDEDAILSVTRQTTYDLRVPATLEAVRGTIHITHDIVYTLDGETLALGSLVNGKAIFEDDELDAFVYPSSETGLEVVEHCLLAGMPSSPPPQDELEMLINGPAAMDQAVRCAEPMFQIMDLLR